MQEELNSMEKNGVWSLVEGCNDMKPIRNEWVFKTKPYSNCNIKRHKARLMAKGVTQEGLDYTKTFSPLSTNDYFRIIIILAAHFDLQLHQMDVKNAFLNDNLDETIYMKSPQGSIEKEKESFVCKLNKPIHGLKQASRQWYKKFDEVVNSFCFIENKIDNYLKVVKSGFIFMVLYVGDILLASSNVQKHVVKQF